MISRNLSLLGCALMLLTGISSSAQVNRLTDDDIVAIKTAAEDDFSAYQKIMNTLTDAKTLSIYLDSIIASSRQIFTENAKIEVDYDSAYLPPQLPYEVSVEKYLGDFYVYHQKEQGTAQIYYTNRRISDMQWDTQEKIFYLTLSYTSVYEGLPPQERVATFRADKIDEQWEAKITYIKFKNSPQRPEEEQQTVSSTQQSREAQISLNELAQGGKKGKQYLISWALPEDHPVSVLLLPQEGSPQSIVTSHRADRLNWTIDQDVKPGKYQLKVLDENKMTSVTSPPFRISSQFPLGLKLAVGVGAGFYLVQTIRNDWNFAWPFAKSKETEPIIPEEPDLPDPPAVPE